GFWRCLRTARASAHRSRPGEWRCRRQRAPAGRQRRRRHATAERGGLMDWLFLFEVVLAGIGAGGLYALAGLAFVIIYKATQVVNLAIGEMLMLGAYAFFAFAAGMQWPIPVAIMA